MKRNEMQHVATNGQSSDPVQTAKQLNDLRLRLLQAKGGFLSLGTTAYMAFIESQAAREGKGIDRNEKVEYRRMMNSKVSLEDADRVALIERALEYQKAA